MWLMHTTTPSKNVSGSNSNEGILYTVGRYSEKIPSPADKSYKMKMCQSPTF